MTRIETWLRRWFRHKSMGWEEYQEVFDRYFLLETRFFSILVHKLIAPVEQPCHDHPWSFWTFILKGGYIEHARHGTCRRHPGDVLFRKAEFAHSVQTPPCVICWSILLIGPRRRDWKNEACKNFGIDVNPISEEYHLS